VLSSAGGSPFTALSSPCCSLPFNRPSATRSTALGASDLVPSKGQVRGMSEGREGVCDCRMALLSGLWSQLSLYCPVLTLSIWGNLISFIFRICHVFVFIFCNACVRIRSCVRSVLFFSVLHYSVPLHRVSESVCAARDGM
jgi:hypothetical protein